MRTIVTPHPDSNTTVVLVGGLGSVAESWTVARAELAVGATVHTFDRPGIGMSPGRRPSWEGMVRSLDLAIQQVGAGQRLILVGHSLGGLIVRDWIHGHPGRAAGVVYLDATHEDQLRNSPKQERGSHWMRQELAANRVRSRLRQRSFLRDHGRQWMDGDLDEASGHAVRSLSVSPVHCDTVYGEFTAWMRRQKSRAGDGDSARGPAVLSVTAEVSAHDDPSQLELHRAYAGAATRGDHQMVTGADHFGIVTSREAVRQWVPAAMAL